MFVDLIEERLINVENYAIFRRSFYEGSVELSGVFELTIKSK